MTAFVFDQREPEKRLLIGSDTLAYTTHATPKPAAFVSKVHPLPILRAAVCAQGMTIYAVNAAAALALREDVMDFDDAVLAMPPILREINNRVAVQYGIEEPDELMLCNVMLCGFSPKHGRALVYAYRNYEHFEPVEPDLKYKGMSSLPTLAANYLPTGMAGKPPEKQIVACMVAMQQYIAENPHVIPATIGGEIVLTEITPQGVSSRVAHQYADYAQTKAAASAVLARLVRGDDELPDINDWFKAADATEDEGDPYAAAAASAAAKQPSGLNRADRRRAEKLARKGRRAA